MMKRTTTLAILILTLSGMLFAQKSAMVPPAFDSSTIKAFADDLYLNGFLDEAAGEYRRFLFSADTVDETAVLTLADIYRTERNHDGIIWLADVFAPQIPPTAAFKLRVLQGKYLFADLVITSFDNYTDTIIQGTVFDSDVFTTLLPVSHCIINKDITGATAILNASTAKNDALQRLTAQCNSYKRKSPVAAVLLSAVIPGSGRWYTGSWNAGFMTLLTIASLGAAAWYTGNSYGWDNWRPWVFSGMAVFSYTVELYGVAKSAVRVNEAAYRKMVTTTEDVYDSLY